MPDAWVKPSPMLSASDTIIMLRLEKPHLASIPKPANIIEPNIMMEHPPRTACGMVVRSMPKAGNTPPRIIMHAPVAMANLFTTPDMAASPTFWLNDVIGVQPNKPAMLLTKPSHDMLAPISALWGFLPKAPLHKALVSPIVSVAETR